MSQNKKKLQVLVFGVGSSGTRFIKILHQKKCQVSVFAHRPNLLPPNGCQLHTNLHDLTQFDAAIIASPSSTHATYAKACLQARIPTLVDKPLATSISDAKLLMKLAEKQQTLLKVGFNLRYLPAITEVTNLIRSGRLGEILYADIYMGQYLPQWRPAKDYRDCYSASYQAGGGVALDLIHDLDLALSWFPACQLKLRLTQKLSTLAIDVEDFVLWQTDKPPFISVRVDYLNHLKTRKYTMVGTEGSLVCDIVRQELILATDDQTTTSRKKLFDLQATFKTEVEMFFQLILQRTHPIITERELGVDALRLALKARKYVPQQ